MHLHSPDSVAHTTPGMVLSAGCGLASAAATGLIVTSPQAAEGGTECIIARLSALLPAAFFCPAGLKGRGRSYKGEKTWDGVLFALGLVGSRRSSWVTANFGHFSSMGAPSSVRLQKGEPATSSPAQSPTEDLFVLGPKVTCRLYHLVPGPFQGQAPAPDARRLRARVCGDSKWSTGALPFWVPSPNKLETRFWVQVFIWKVVPRSKSEGVGKREEGRESQERECSGAGYNSGGSQGSIPWKPAEHASEWYLSG